jgi:hypothetical protein
MNLDDDLILMSESDLRAEAVRLRAAIRKHRDSAGHNLCWFQPELWSLLPESSNAPLDIPERIEFLRRCEEYYSSLVME